MMERMPQSALRGLALFAAGMLAFPHALAQTGEEKDPPGDEPAGEAAAPVEEPEGGTPALAEATEGDGQRRTITEFNVVYTRQVEGRPTPEQVLGAVIVLSPSEEGWLPPRAGAEMDAFTLAELPEQELQSFYDSALPLIAQSVVKRLQGLGYIGVYVEPDPAQIRVEEGAVVDDRGPGDTTLTLLVTMGVVEDVRTTALGSRVTEGAKVNLPIHERIRAHSPVQPSGAAVGGEKAGEEGEGKSEDAEPEKGEHPTSLLRGDLIDDYVYRLNRHPGRRVEVAVVPSGGEFGGVSLDYLVTENKAWIVYAQLANTGSSATSRLQERFGFLDYQLTNHDDIFDVSWLTGSFDEVNGITASYDRPLSDDGLWRGRVFGSWYTYTAADIGQTGLSFDGTGYSIGAEGRWNFYQDKDFFADLVGSLRVEAASVDNGLTATEGDGTFLIPSIGVRAERVRKTDRFGGGVALEFNTLSNSGADLTALGRNNTDETWVLLRYDAGYSFYIEPLLAEEDEPTALAHEISLSARGQLTPSARLTPTMEQVAGGMFTVRGYPEAAVAGDSVILATAEYRYHVPQGLSPRVEASEFLGSPFRVAPQYESGPTDWDLILKGFVDAGWVSVNDALSFESDETLLGVGVGLELQWTRNLRGQVDFAWAGRDLTDTTGTTTTGAGDFEVHFLITVMY